MAAQTPEQALPNGTTLDRLPSLPSGASQAPTTPPPPPPPAAGYRRADGTPLVHPPKTREASTQTETPNEEADSESGSPRRPPRYFEPMSYEDDLECLDLSSSSDLRVMTDACREATTGVVASAKSGEECRHVYGAVVALAQQHRSLHWLARFPLEAEIDYQLDELNVEPLAPSFSSLAGYPGHPRSFDAVTSVEDAWAELGVTAETAQAEVRKMCPSDYDSPESYRKEGAFIALCLFSSNGLKPSDAIPMLSIEAVEQLRSVKPKVNDRSFGEVYTDFTSAPPASSTKAVSKQSKLRLKAAAQAEATEAKLRRDLAAAKATLATSSKREVQLESKSETLRKRVAQLEDSVGSRQKWYQRVETEVQRRVASVKEEMSVVRSEMAKTRAAADAAESKLKAATEMASADSRAAQEEHAAIIEQLEKERDEAREALQQARQHGQSSTSTRLNPSTPTWVCANATNPTNSPSSPSPNKSAFVIALLRAQVEELSQQVVEKNEEITELMLRLAGIKQ